MPNKSKKQIASELQKVHDVKKMRAFVKNQFYPALLKATSSIDDAKFLLSSFSNMLMEQFLSQMKQMPFLELKLHEKLDPQAANYKEYVELLSAFAGENVYDARELIEGMKAEIEMMVNKELKERKLETLQTNFLD